PETITDILFDPFNHSPLGAILGLGLIVFGGFVAVSLYWRASEDPLTKQLGWVATALRSRLFFDAIYDRVVVPIHDAVAALFGLIDRWLLQGLVVRGGAGAVDLVGRALRLVQTGNIQTYAFLFVIGVAVLVVLALK
ncbi:MAG: hypothetical protein RLZ45_23, partial [Verrucomicrobiota bacterium]